MKTLKTIEAVIVMFFVLLFALPIYIIWTIILLIWELISVIIELIDPSCKYEKGFVSKFIVDTNKTIRKHYAEISNFNQPNV